MFPSHTAAFNRILVICQTKEACEAAQSLSEAKIAEIAEFRRMSQQESEAKDAYVHDLQDKVRNCRCYPSPCCCVYQDFRVYVAVCVSVCCPSL
jgi:hypothetical protein